MSEGSRGKPRFRARRRRWPWVLAGLAVAGAIAWLVVERLIAVDRYRPQLVRRLEEVTRLPASIEFLDLSLLPFPSVRARSVSVGEGDFRARCAEVVLRPRIESLGRGVIEIEELVLEGLEVHLPREPAATREKFGRFDFRPSPGPRGPFRAVINRVVTREARVFLGDAAQPALVASAEARDVLSPEISVSVNGAAPLLGPETKAVAELTLTRNSEAEPGLGIRGRVDIQNAEPFEAFGRTDWPAIFVSASASIERTGPRTFAASIRGVTAPASEAPPEMKPFLGETSANAAWDDGVLTFNDIAWKADGIELTGNATLTPGQGVAAHVASARLNQAGLQALAALVSRNDGYRVDAPANAGATLADALFGYEWGKAPRLANGKGTFTGIGITRAGGESIVKGLSGAFSLREGVIRLEQANAEGLRLSGEIRPDFDAGTVGIQLAGDVEATAQRVRLLIPTEAISKAEGAVRLESVRGTFGGGQGLPADLAIAGRVSNGLLEFATDTWSEMFSGISMVFSAQPGGVDTQATANSGNFGPITAAGRYEIQARAWKGTASGDLSRVNPAFLLQPSAREAAPGVLASFGASTFAVEIDLPRPETPDAVRVQFERQGAPRLNGSVAWQQQRGAWTLGDVEIHADVAAESVGPILPDTMTASGPMDVTFTRALRTERFDAHIEMTPVRLTLGDYLRKLPGQFASIDISGTAPAGSWAAEQLTVQCLGQTVRGRYTGDGFAIDPTDLDAAALAALLGDESKGHGDVRVSFRTPPPEGNVEFVDVSLALSPELRIDRVSGQARFLPESTELGNFMVEGANSSFRVDATAVNGNWRGRVTGPQLDVNALIAFQDALQRHAQGAAGNRLGAEGAEGAGGVTGVFEAAFEKVLYRRGTLERVRCNVAAGSGALDLTALTLASGAGQAAGEIRIVQARNGQPGITRTRLQLANFDAAVIDGVAFEQPRGLTGKLHGAVDMQTYSGEALPLLAHSTGSVRLRGEQGSFGKVGIATKVLGVLRTFEITRLRPPTLKDEGLTYDTCTVDLIFNDGVMTVREISVNTPTYIITAIGGIDFNHQQTEMLVHVNLLETVLGPSERVPGLRDIVRAIRSAGGLQILVTGPPDDPTTRYALGPQVKTITNEVRSALRSGKGIVVDEVLKRGVEALRQLIPR